jgi:hypothetical protein
VCAPPAPSNASKKSDVAPFPQSPPVATKRSSLAPLLPARAPLPACAAPRPRRRARRGGVACA